MHLPGRAGGPVVERATAVAVVRRAVELGARHFDTAAFYAHGANRANDILRTALHPYPAGVTIATKVGPLRAPTGEMIGEARPDQLRPAVEQNLRDLPGAAWPTAVGNRGQSVVGGSSLSGMPPNGRARSLLSALNGTLQW